MFQLVTTFAAWLLVECLGLAGVIIVLVLCLTLTRCSTAALRARIRLPTPARKLAAARSNSRRWHHSQ